MQPFISRRMFVGGLAGLVAPASALAQGYPNKPMRLIVSFAPGGPTDVLARMLGEALGRKLGQSIVVENHGGAGGNIGYALGASAAPDGYTLIFADPSIVINASLYKARPFEVERDYAAVSGAFRGPTILVVPGNSSFTSLANFISHAKANPGKLSYGSAGNGTPPHRNAELIKDDQGLDIVHVPYRGAAPAIVDLAAGRIDMMCLNIGSAKSQIENGELRGLAVSGPNRAPAPPDVPTFREGGIPMTAMDPGTWWGLVVPAKTPGDIVARLNAAMRECVQDPDLQRRLASMSVEPIAGPADDFFKLALDEQKKWADVIAKARITVE